ncbi:unnamed protein product [Adineta steineri]|uniref:Uncharacterized protein n=1 Tax=Adineta steineri TaxID=433720 RepID=A0A814WEW7_9BILA|nr:unnamed protein product [Adineta steineri]
MAASDEFLCVTCQTSYGFNSIEQRGLIILIILVLIVLVVCYASVLWFGIRTRFQPTIESNVMTNNLVHNNRAYFYDDDDDEFIQPVNNTNRSPPPPPPATTTPREHLLIDIDT